MKSPVVKSLFVCLIFVFANFGSTIQAQKKVEKGEFSSVNLSSLKRTLQKNLINDGLVKSKNDVFFLSITKDSMVLNDKKLSTEMRVKYQKLLTPFKVGFGPDRKVYISPKGTALGDFKEKGFYGIAKGTFDGDVLGGGLVGL